jgi:hypothetical protein
MNPRDFCTSPEEMNLGSHIVSDPFTVAQNPEWKWRHDQTQQLLQKELS